VETHTLDIRFPVDFGSQSLIKSPKRLIGHGARSGFDDRSLLVYSELVGDFADQTSTCELTPGILDAVRCEQLLPSVKMSVTNGPVLPLSLAFFIIFITIAGGGGYVALKTWYYFLNSRFRRRSADIREKLGKEATLSETKNRAVFVGFFHPYWYVPPERF